VQEPSMEEILASIRRIIADDEAKPPVADTKPAAVERPAAPPPARAEKPPAPAPAPKPVMNDIPPSKIAPPSKAAAPAPPPAPAPAPPPPAPPPAASANNSQDDIDALLNGLDEATTEEEIRPAQPEAEVFELTDDMAVPSPSVAPPSQPAFHKIE